MKDNWDKYVRYVWIMIWDDKYGLVVPDTGAARAGDGGSPPPTISESPVYRNCL